MRSALLFFGQSIGGASLFRRYRLWRHKSVLIPHLVALALMGATESTLTAMAAFLLACGLLNFLWLALLRRPAAAGLLSLVMMTVLVLLSQLKYQVLMMTANFVDLMIIDTDTVTFLFTIFPALRLTVTLSAVAFVPLLALAWRFDTIRVRRVTALSLALLCLGGLTALEKHSPVEPFVGYYGGNHVSNFARSGVDAVSELMRHGLMESDPGVAERLKSVEGSICRPATKPPRIILVHDESSFDIRMAPGIKLPSGYGSHFLSFDVSSLTSGASGPAPPRRRRRRAPARWRRGDVKRLLQQDIGFVDGPGRRREGRGVDPDTLKHLTRHAKLCRPSAGSLKDANPRTAPHSRVRTKRRGRALAASPETCWSECRPVPRSPLNPKNGTLKS
jgi:hypothetical protein